MSISWTKSIAAIILLITGVLAFTFFSRNENKSQVTITTEAPFRVISTNPDPLEGATILANREIEITFSKPVFISDLKIQIEPPWEYNVETVNQVQSNTSQTFKITFRKPLDLGGGYTLLVSPETRTKEKENLDKEYIYHFKTIKFKGV